MGDEERAEGPKDPVVTAQTTDSGSPLGAPTAPGNLRRRMTQKLRRDVAAGTEKEQHAAVELGHAARAIALTIVPTGLDGARALVGHVLGMHLTLPAGHLHGPRQAPALVYLFADALAIRPTDDAPMSTVPMFGLHMVLPPAAVAHWVYKAGRIEHANLDLVKEEERFSSSIAQWTIDDFLEADPKLQMYRAAELTGALHVYEHVGFANLTVPVADGRPVRLRSSLPVSSESFVQLWQLFTLVHWPQGLSTRVPAGMDDRPPGPPTAPPSH
jgi:hypothetical protein